MLFRSRLVADAGVGQTVVVKRGAVAAVEAIEGTTETIRRGITGAGVGAVVVEVVEVLAAVSSDCRLTILEECWRPAFARSLAPKSTALECDLDETRASLLTPTRRPAPAPIPGAGSVEVRAVDRDRLLAARDASPAGGTAATA